jgi:hypothetical protein
MVVGTYLAWTPSAWVPVHSVFDWFVAYNGLIAVTLNVAVSTLSSLAIRSNARTRPFPTTISEDGRFRRERHHEAAA